MKIDDSNMVVTKELIAKKLAEAKDDTTLDVTYKDKKTLQIVVDILKTNIKIITLELRCLRIQYDNTLLCDLIQNNSSILNIEIFFIENTHSYTFSYNNEQMDPDIETEIKPLAQKLMHNMTLQKLNYTAVGGYGKHELKNWQVDILLLLLNRNQQMAKINGDETSLVLNEIYLDEKCATMLFAKQSENQKLIALRLKKCSIEKAAFVSIVEFIKKNTTLVKLEISHLNELSQESLAPFQELAAHPISIKYLILNDNAISAVGISFLAPFIKACQSLCLLNLSDNPLTGKGIITLTEVLQFNSRLCYLYLTHTECQNEGALALSRLLKVQDTSLAELAINNCKISKDGVKHIASSLETNKKLYSLDLSSNPVSDEGLALLAASLLKNHCLHALILGNANLSQGGLTSFIRRIDPSQDKSKRAAEKRNAPKNTVLTELTFDRALLLSDNYVYDKRIGTTVSKPNYTEARKCLQTFVTANNEYRTRLLTSATQKKLHEVKEHLAKTSLYILNEDSNTLLHIAAKEKDEDTLEYLLEQGFNRHLINKNHETALMIAQKSLTEKPDTVPLDITEKAKTQKIIALLTGEEKPVANALKLLKPDPMVSKKRKSSSKTPSKDAKQPEIGSMLLKAKKAKETSNSSEDVFLPMQDDEETKSEVSFISALSTSSVISSSSSSSSSSMMSTTTDMDNLRSYIADGQKNQLQRLLDHDPSLIAYIDLIAGESALHLAVRHGQKECAEIFIKAGADVNHKDNKGNTPLHLLVHTIEGTSEIDPLIKRKLELAYLLIQNGADPNRRFLLHQTVTSGFYRLMKILLQSPSCDLNKPNSHHMTALNLAVEKRNVTMVDRLLIDRRLSLDSVKSALDQAKKLLNKAEPYTLAYDLIQQMIVLLEKRKNAKYPSADSGIQRAQNYSVMFGSRFNRNKKTLVLNNKKEHAYLCQQNELTRNKLLASQESKSSADTDSKKGDTDNPVTANIVFVVSAQPYKKSENSARISIVIDLDFIEHHHANVENLDEKSSAQFISRIKAVPTTVFNQVKERRGDAAKILSSEDVLSAYQALQQSNDPGFQQLLHHGEQGLFNHLEKSATVEILVDRLSNDRTFINGCKVYGVILNIFSPRYVCGNCEIALLGEQDGKNSPFIKLLSERLRLIGCILPAFSPLRMITQVSSFPSVTPSKSPETADKELHTIQTVDMRDCHNMLILAQDMSVFPPTMTQYHSTAAKMKNSIS